MAIANEQLRQIFRDLQTRFQNDQYIRITPLGDDPPEKYEIHYNILGAVQKGDGSIIVTRDHSILISIPFGFPHFPPSCRPQTAVFHPDFDQAAICIGDFWDKDKSLSELIIHIGQMISGEMYSTENAFNDAALGWYLKNKDKLPFETLSFSPALEDLEDFQDFEDFEEIEDVEKDRPPAGVNDNRIDTLEDDDLSTDLDYLSVEHTQTNIEEEEIPGAEIHSTNRFLNKAQLMLRQKRFFELSTFLSTLPKEDHFERMGEIGNDVELVLGKARKLQREADQFENQGHPDRALECLEKIRKITPDFPNISENIARTRKACQLKSEWEDETKVEDDSSPETTQPPADKKRGPGKRLIFFNENYKPSVKIIPLLAVAITLVLVMVFIVPILRVNSHLQDADRLLVECNALLDQEMFSQALNSCESAQTILTEVTFFKKKEQAALSNRINVVITSEKMQQGLLGKVLFQGKYIRKSDKEIVLAFNTAKEEGDTYLKESAWEKASEKYLAAFKIAKPAQENFDEETLNELSTNNSIANINILFNTGEQFLVDGELDQSREIFSQALDTANGLPKEIRTTFTSRIEPKLSEIEYLEHLDLGTKFFVSNDWEAAIAQYQKALQLRNQSSLANSSGDETLYTNIAEAELYSLISNGKDAFSRAQWNEAISRYMTAIELLNTKGNLLQRINPEAVQQQLQRIIVRAKIVQHKQDADSKLEKRLYEEAIVAFEKVIAVITEHNLQNDREFSSIYSGTNASIADARLQLQRGERISYLVNNYKKIFQDHYSAAIPEYLSDPKATFLKNIGNKELFELQCQENNKGRQIRLILQYIYDPETRGWQFYSDKG